MSDDETRDVPNADPDGWVALHLRLETMEDNLSARFNFSRNTNPTAFVTPHSGYGVSSTQPSKDVRFGSLGSGPTGWPVGFGIDSRPATQPTLFRYQVDVYVHVAGLVGESFLHISNDAQQPLEVSVARGEQWLFKGCIAHPKDWTQMRFVLPARDKEAR